MGTENWGTHAIKTGVFGWAQNRKPLFVVRHGDARGAQTARQLQRTEDTLNRVFADVAEGRYIDVTMPEIAPPPAIDELLVVAPLV